MGVKEEMEEKSENDVEVHLCRWTCGDGHDGDDVGCGGGGGGVGNVKKC